MQVDQGRSVSMYVTGKDCVPSGPFAGPMMVKQAPCRADELPLVASVSGLYPSMHGAPVHIGAPDALGISNLTNPKFGDAINIAED
jgi:uncharacterized protein YcsI (UPF0317 family)